ncbi:hypothetical protein P2318_10415 [Myxococcaceae bacterium GXIMD 01537]
MALFLLSGCLPPPNNPGAFQAFMAGHQNNTMGGVGAPSAPAEDDAASVCASIMLSSDRLSCVQGSQGKEYTSSELATCRGMMLSEKKRDCMIASGTRRAPPPAVVAHHGPAAAPPPAAAPAHDRTRVMKFQNFNAKTVTRIMWRPEKEVRFREIALRRPVEQNGNAEVEVGTGRIDLCFELPPGERVFVTGMDDSLPYFLVPATEKRISSGTCVDTL